MPFAEKRRVLWIEDGTLVEFPEFATPVYVSGKYHLSLAQDATKAVRLLSNGGNEERFDAVVFDLRLQPGKDPSFAAIYQTMFRDQVPPRLGLYLLLNYMIDYDRSGSIRYPMKLSRPAWLTLNRIGIFSVDPWSEVEDELKLIGFPKQSFAEKKVDISRTTLLDLLNDIFRS